MAKINYEYMLPHEILSARKASPLAYLPLGPIEWHGLHNPVGLDALKAKALCELAAEKGGGLVMPPLWWGEHREIQLLEANPATREAAAQKMELRPEDFSFGSMGGKTIEEQAHFYNELLFHIYQQLANLGFKAIFVMCGHGPLPLYANFTAEVFMRKSPVRVFATSEAALISAHAKELGCPVKKGEDWEGDHAGKWETSILMALYPELVDLSLLPQEEDAELIGIMGEDPRKSNLEFGKRAVELILNAMVDKGKHLLQEAETI